jgi:hypothetical protein
MTALSSVHTIDFVWCTGTTFHGRIYDDDTNIDLAADLHAHHW